MNNTKAKPRLARAPIMAMLAVSSVMVASIAGLSWRNGHDWAVADAEAASSRQVMDAADDLLSAVKDAETGQRGYLLTGKDSYLDSYRTAVVGMPSMLSRLRQSVAQLPDQQERVRAVEPVVAAKMEELAKTVELQRSEGFSGALEEVQTGAGRAFMNEIRRQCAAIREIADRRVATFSRVAEASGRRLQIVGTLGSMGIFCFLIVSAVTIFRGLAHREKLYREAATNAELLHVTLTSIGDAVITTDTSGMVTFINPVGQQLTGWPAKEAVGTPMSKVFHIVNEATREEVENPAEKAMRMSAVVGLANHTILITKQGSEVAIDDSGAPIRDADGEVVGAILVFRDISEQRAAERQLKQSNEQLQQFVTAAAHDLRSPLNSTSAVAEMLASRLGPKADGEETQLLEYVRGGVRRVLSLVDALVSYAQASHFEPQGEKADLQAVIGVVLQNLRAEIETSGAVVNAGTLPVVAAREGHMVQLLQNLIGNAIKYRSEAIPEVRIACEDRGPEWVVSVRDNGIGIPADYLGAIFNPFKRLHGDEVPGSGIGLATCQKIVVGYGGKLWVTSVPGAGSTFFFSLPHRAGQGS